MKTFEKIHVEIPVTMDKPGEVPREYHVIVMDQPALILTRGELCDHIQQCVSVLRYGK